MRKILITGTAGFIGFHLAKSLLDGGAEVFGIDSINEYYDVRLKFGRLAETGIGQKDIEYKKLVNSNKYSGYRFVKLNLEDKEELFKLFKDEQFNIVVNLAAQAGVRYSITNPQTYIHSNILGFLNLLEACRYYNVEHLIYASSSSVYGLNSKMPFSVNDNTDHPISLYAASKKSNELMAYSYSHLFNIPTTGLRLFTVYGPWGRPDMAPFLFTRAIDEGKPLQLYNNGEMRRDFTYIDDVIHGLLCVINKQVKANNATYNQNTDQDTSKAPYIIYNIGNSAPVKLIDFISALEEAIGKKAIIDYLPMQPGDVLATWANVDDFQKIFKYKPVTNFRDGVKGFVKWYFDIFKSQKFNL